MEEKRQLIIERTFGLFHRYGIKSVSMDDIARELGISKKTLYQHVKDKSELVDEVVEYIRGFMEEFISVFYDDTLNAIEQHKVYWQKIDTKFVNCKPNFLYDLRKYYPAILQNINDWKRKAVYKANYNNFEKGKKEGLYRPDLDSHIIAKVLVGYHIFIFDPAHELFTEVEASEQKTFDQVNTYHFHGVCTPEGMQEVKRLFNDFNRNNHKTNTQT